MNHSHSDHHMGEQTFGRSCAALRQQMQLTQRDLDWSPDSTHLVSGSSNGQVLLWEVTGTAPLKVLGTHEWVVFGVAWSPDGRWLASSGDDGAIRICWDLHRGELMRTLRHDPLRASEYYGPSRRN
jgi:WD40 repeat protein